MGQPYAVVTVEQMRALEASAFASGISEQRLQANAARQVALVAGQLAPAGGRVVVLVGPGNNGRDAFLAGRLLAERGRLVHYHLAPRHAVQPDELAQLRPGRESSRQHQGDDDLPGLARELELACLAIDGLLGIGVRGPFRPPLGRLARALNTASAAGLTVLAVDLPSGLEADSGVAPPDTVRASVTVALGAVKSGTMRFPGRSLAGRIVPVPIGLPPGADDCCPVRLLEPAGVADLIPPRPLEAHKGRLGWVLVVGGSREYVGAPILSAAAAARSGCGLVALAVPPSAQAAAASALPEATYLLRDEHQPAEVQAELLQARLADFDALVLGPGLGRAEPAQRLARALLTQSAGRRLATVIDADALFALAHWPEWWRAIASGCVLTPHHGEMARLIDRDGATLSIAAWETALEFAARWNQIVVLKSALTVIASPDGRAWVHSQPNPALATAGTGDILAGLIGGLIAQSLDALDAVRLAVVVHSLAADSALRRQGWRSLLASDLLSEIPARLAANWSDQPSHRVR